jgi:hypothetical protein
MRQDDTLLVGNTLGVNRYFGYLDNAEPYVMRYYSNPLSFGDTSRVKFPKKITPTLISEGVVDVGVKWSYDFTNDFKTQTFRVNSQGSSYFGKNKYGTAKFSAGSSKITAKRINTSGSGNLVSVGLESTINASPLSIQEFNIQATIGRIY